MALLKIAALEIYRFSIPFIQPIKVGNVALSCREGFLIELVDDQGRKALGEVAPLPGLDQANLNQCRSDLLPLRKMIVNTAVSTDSFDLKAPGLGMMPVSQDLTPHTLFGLECALLSLYLQTNPSCLPEIITVPVNGLFIPDASEDQADRQITTLQQNGMKTIKVKIGRMPADREIRQILRLVEAIGQNLRLRLDGNRSLSASLYHRYFSALGHLKVDYAEEPLSEDLSFTSQDVPWPIALDESLARYLDPSHPDADTLPAGVRTVILKPGLLPGLSGMASFIASARTRNIQTVLSSAFNTGVGLAALSFFSVMAGLSSDIALGFDTLRYLQTDAVQPSLALSGGAFTIPRNLPADMRLNFCVLSKEDL